MKRGLFASSLICLTLQAASDETPKFGTSQDPQPPFLVKPGTQSPTGKVSPTVSETMNHMIRYGLIHTLENKPQALQTEFGQWWVKLGAHGFNSLYENKKAHAKSLKYTEETLDDKFVKSLLHTAKKASKDNKSELQRVAAWGAFGAAFSIQLKKLMEKDIPELNLLPTLQETITCNSNLKMTDENSFHMNAGELAQGQSLEIQYRNDQTTFNNLFGKYETEALLVDPATLDEMDKMLEKATKENTAVQLGKIMAEAGIQSL